MISLSSLPPWVIEAATFIVGCGFLLGFILMNAPQHYQCWKYRSAEGLSLAYILICTVSNVTCTLASLMGDYHDIIATATNTTTGAGGGDNTTDIDYLWNVTNPASSTLTADGSSMPSMTMMLMDPASQPPPHPEELDLSFRLYRLFATLNASMPTMQNFLTVLVGVPSLIFYYFYFSTPQPYHPSRHGGDMEGDAGPSSQPLLGATRQPQSQQELHDDCDDAECRRESSGDMTAALSVTTTSFDEEDDVETNSNLQHHQQQAIITRSYYYSDGTEYNLAKILTILTGVGCGVATVFSFAVLLATGNHAPQLETTLLQVWGSTGAVTNMILYIPQIVTTWRNQHEGVLSLASLVFSVWGDLSCVAFWIFSTGETAWVYAALVADAGMQLILIGMIIDFRNERARARANAQDDYDFVYDADGDQVEQPVSSSSLSKGGGGGEIEVVYGEVLAIYNSTTSALESLWDTTTQPTTTTTTHQSMDVSSSPDFII